MSVGSASPEGSTALAPWEPAPVPAALAEPGSGPGRWRHAITRGTIMQVAGVAGLVGFFKVAPLVAFASLLFGVGGGALAKLGRRDEAGRLDITLREGLTRPKWAAKLLAHYAQRGSSVSMRWSARAWLALYAIESGDLESATRAYRGRDDWTQAWLDGELDPDALLVPAVLSWIVPMAFAPGSVPRRAAIHHTRIRNAPFRTEVLPSLSLMLEALEATAAEDRGYALRAIQRLEASATRQHFPKLSLLVRAQVGRLIPELRADIDAELDPASREFLARVMPTYAKDELRGVFRTPAQTRQSGERPAPRAPLAVRERVEVAARTRGRDRIERFIRLDRRLGTVIWGGATASVVSIFIFGGYGAALAIAGLGTSVAVGLGRAVHRRIARRRTHVSALLGVEGLALPAWRAELDAEFPTLIQKDRYDGSSEAAQQAGALTQECFVSCAMAERAWRRGDLDELEAAIAWCFEDLVPAAIEASVLRCCGASLVRLAAATGRHEIAAQIFEVAKAAAPAWYAGRHPRSAYGGARSALALAGAWAALLRGEAETAARLLAETRGWRWARAWPRDRLLYAQMIAKLRARVASSRELPVYLAPDTTEGDRAWLVDRWRPCFGEAPSYGSREVPVAPAAVR